MLDSTLNDGLCRTSWRSRPGSFVGLMTLYESNYIRLRQLLGDPASLPDARVSYTPDDCPLYLQVSERSRYTVTFTLTYRFLDGTAVVADPDLQVRVYHDARLGEVLHCARWHQQRIFALLRREVWSDPQARARLREMDQRWRRNILLNKWLDYCVERGHSFSS